MCTTYREVKAHLIENEIAELYNTRYYYIYWRTTLYNIYKLTHAKGAPQDIRAY